MPPSGTTTSSSASASASSSRTAGGSPPGFPTNIGQSPPKLEGAPAAETQSFGQIGPAIVPLSEHNPEFYAPFNGSFTIDIDGNSPMIDMADGQTSNLVWDSKQQVWTPAFARRSSAFSICWAGMGYTFNGWGEWYPGYPDEYTTVFAEHRRFMGMPQRDLKMDNFTVGPGNTLGSKPKLQNGLQVVQLVSSIGATIGFRNVTIRVPIRTQA